MKGFLFRLTTIFAILIIILIFTEIGLRIFWNGKPRVPNFPPSPGYYEDTDPEISYTLIPDHKYKGSRIKADEYGFRGEPSPEIVKRQGVFRIVLIGDSIVFGVRTPSDKTIGSVLQKRLDEIVIPGVQKFEVINLGMPGHNINQYAAVLKKYGMRFSPDLIIAGITISNDLEGRQARFLGNGHLYLEPTASFDGVNISHKLPPRLIRLSYIWRYLYFHYLGPKRMERIKELKIAADDVPAKMLFAPMDETDEVWEGVTEGLESIKNTARIGNSKLLFLLFPAIEQIYYKDIPNTPQRIIGKILRKYNLNFMDFYNVFRDNYWITGMLPFNDLMSHPSQKAYDIIASSIRDLLAQEYGAGLKKTFDGSVKLGFVHDHTFLSYGWGQRRKIGNTRFRNIQGSEGRIVFSGTPPQKIMRIEIKSRAWGACSHQSVDVLINNEYTGNFSIASAGSFSNQEIVLQRAVSLKKFNTLTFKVRRPCQSGSKELLEKRQSTDSVSISEVKLKSYR
jgi:hypothetical protein